MLFLALGLPAIVGSSYRNSPFKAKIVCQPNGTRSNKILCGVKQGCRPAAYYASSPAPFAPFAPLALTCQVRWGPFGIFDRCSAECDTAPASGGKRKGEGREGGYTG